MKINSLNQLSSAQLQRASDLKKRIETLEKELGGLLGAAPATAAEPIVRKKRRKMSAASKAKIAAAAKARWAKVRAAKKA